MKQSAVLTTGQSIVNLIQFNTLQRYLPNNSVIINAWQALKHMCSTNTISDCACRRSYHAPKVTSPQHAQAPAQSMFSAARPSSFGNGGGFGQAPANLFAQARPVVSWRHGRVWLGVPAAVICWSLSTGLLVNNQVIKKSTGCRLTKLFLTL